MKRIGVTVELFLVLLAALASIALSTQVVLMTTRQMGTQAALVVRGTVDDVKSSWNEKGTKIFTKISIATAETYKGRQQPAVEIVQLGGVVGNVRMTVSGALLWKRGEEVLLFLEPYKDNAFQITGFSQGKYVIERDPATGMRFVRGAAAEVDGFAPASSDGRPAQRAGGERIELESFLAEALGVK